MSCMLMRLCGGVLLLFERKESMTTSQQRVLEYFAVEFDRFVLPDLGTLAAIRPGPDGLCGCAVPQAMVIFSIFDLLGYLTNPDPNASKRRTMENYRPFFASPLGLLPPEYAAETDRVVRLFRHGLIHQFFPKASSIAKASSQRPLIFPDGQLQCLNVDRLTQDAIVAIARLRTLIGEPAHAALAKQMSDRLDLLNQEDFQELNAIT